MIRMTRQADYGVVLMTHLATQPERIVKAPEMAAETQLPGPMVSKILKLLAKGGLVESHRGAKGGYSLARAPHEISMAAIIAAIEGPIAITECIDDGPGECSQEAFCPVRGNWNRINEGIRQALEAISLAEMTHPLTSPVVTLGESSSSSHTVEAR